MKINSIKYILYLLISFLILQNNIFAIDLEAEKKKLERELEGRIANEIRRYFADLKFLVTAEVTFSETASETPAEQQDIRDLGLPGAQGFEPSRLEEATKTSTKPTIENVLIKLLIEKNRTKEDRELLESVAFYTAKLDNARGDRVEIQDMVFPDTKTLSKDELQNNEAIKKIAQLETEKKSIEEQIRVESVKRIEELEKTSKETQEKLTTEQQNKINELTQRVEETTKKIEEERSKLQQQQQEARESFDPLVKWFLIIFGGLVIVLLLINMFLTRLKNAQPKIEYLPQQAVGEVQAIAETAGEKKGVSFEESVQEMTDGFELEKMRSKLVATCAGESNIASTVIRDMMADAAHKDKLSIVTEQLGGSMFKVMKDYFSIDEIKKIQEISLESVSKTNDEKKQALQYLDTQIMVKRFEESRNKAQNPFAFLEKLTDSQLYMMVKDEAPGIVAIILSQLSTPAASQMLKNLPSMQQGEVALELGKLNRMDSDTYKSVASQLATKASTIPVINNVQVQGSDMLLDIFDNLDEQSESSIIDFIKTINLDLYREISNQRVAFQAIGKLDDKMLRQLARDISGEELSIALKNAPPEITERMLSLLPTKARTLLEDRMATLKSVTPDDELKARRRITKMIRTYVKSGIGTLAAVTEEAKAEEGATETQGTEEGQQT